MATLIAPNQAIISRRTAFRTVNGYRIVATYSGGPYIDLHWNDANGPAFEVINVWDYRTGSRKPFNLSQELTDWVRENRREIANYWRHTA
jgi:hypothetical protein